MERRSYVFFHTMKFLKKMMFILLVVATVLTVAVFLFVQQKSFGRPPGTLRTEAIKQSPHYVDGRFANLHPTSVMAEDASYIKVLTSYFSPAEGREPAAALPIVKTDLKQVEAGKPVIVWFGHSSLLIKAGGKNILVDPVFSERASPVQYAGSKRYPGTSVYSVDDLPHIDYLFITHDHYDHLDYETITRLKAKTGKFFVPLGVGSHLEYWGIEQGRITELDWWDSKTLSSSMEIIATPARHFSGRGLTDRNKTLWASYVLILPGHRIYIGGDSGYDTHFKEIGEKYGPFDLVILESGQYNAYWPHIHMMPEETVQASLDLRGKVLQPVHWGKFTLALHPWDEPVKRVQKKAEELDVTLTTPRIGEPVVLDSIYPAKAWWGN